MSKNILLARPHPFIVSEMKPFLEHAGYTTTKLDSLQALPEEGINDAGAVISLAVSSSTGASAVETFARLRRVAPHVPVMFASMLEFVDSRSGLERLAENAGVKATLLGVAAGNDSTIALGKPGTFLYISKADLADPARRALASRMIQRHFR
jgi:DNA-binding NarL/FixJ family response regulator